MAVECSTRASTVTGQVQFHLFLTWIWWWTVADPTTKVPTVDELGYFYDAIHGRIALEELPEQFHPALKSAFASRTLERLKRISQLGHTSVSFVSATHTLFSHAIGTMLVMNNLFRHVAKTGLPQQVFDEASLHYSDSVKHFGGAHTMVHCHPASLA